MTEDAHELVCSGCGRQRDRGEQYRYCRACKRVADRRRARRLRLALEICQRAGVAIPPDAAGEAKNRHGVDAPVPPERRDSEPEQAVTSKP